jgi:hypothetical protein
MKIAYIDHSFHRKTGSTQYFVDLLKQAGDVDLFWDESWSGGDTAPFDRIRDGGYDAIVVFQSESAAAQMARRKPECPFVFVPMWDSSGSFPARFWREEIAGSRVVCSSSRQAEQLARWGVDVISSRYWLEPPEKAPELRAVNIRALFWWRRRELPLCRILQLCDFERMQSLHVHLGPDPGHELDESQLADAPISLTVTRWGADPDAYRKVLADADLVFAPRLQEGFGTTVLEAMAAGKAVVAADGPAMNEYITDGVTGYLVPASFASPIKLDGIREVGRRAREAALKGRKNWVESQKDLLDWMFARPSMPARRSAKKQSPADAVARRPGSSAQMHAGLRESLAAVPPGSTLLVGHYAETIDGFPAERRSFLPSSWQKWSGDLAALLPRIPLPQAVVGAGADANRMTAADFAVLLASQKLHHLDECLETLPDEGPAGRRYRMRYQAEVLRASGFPAAEVDRALRCALSELHTQEYDAAVCRGGIVLRPSLWPEWWRRTWPIWKKHGVRGGLHLILARFKNNSAHNGVSTAA